MQRSNNWVNPAAVREILPFTCHAFRVSWRVYRSLSCWGASGDSARQHKTRLWPQHDCSLFLVRSFSQIEIKIFPLFAIWPPDVRHIVSSSQYRLTFVGAHCARLRGHKIRRGECEERSPPNPFPLHTPHTHYLENTVSIKVSSLELIPLTLDQAIVNNPRILGFVFGNFSVTLEYMNTTLKTQFFADFLPSILIDS